MITAKSLKTKKIASVVMDKKKYSDLFSSSLDSEWSFEICSLFEFERRVESGSYDVLLIDASTDVTKQSHRLFSKNSPIVFLFEHDDMSHMIRLLYENENVNHILCASGGRYQERLIQLFEQLSNPDPFRMGPLAKIADMNCVTIKESGQKSKILNDIKQFSSELNGFEGFPTTVQTIAWELITNAIFDAPITSDSGRSKYDTLPRSEPLKLERHEYVSLAYASYDNFIVLSVKDQFGSLDRATIVKNLYRCDQKGCNQMHNGPGSTGAGLYTALNLTTQLDFYIIPGVSTEIVCLIDVSRRHKDYEERGVAINLFIKE